MILLVHLTNNTVSEPKQGHPAIKTNEIISQILVEDGRYSSFRWNIYQNR